MTTEHLDNARTIERLDLLTRLTLVFQRTDRARLIWSRHHQHELGQLPVLTISTSNGMYDVEGLLIHGQRDGEEWDLNGTLTLLTEDGEIISINGWMATEMEAW